MTTTSIRATSRTSIKVGDSFYTVEYCEERSINPEDDIEEARADLWETCNNEVDNQVEDILKAFKKR